MVRPQGIEANEAPCLSESIFAKRKLQRADVSKEAWRKGSQSAHIESPGDDPQREPVKPIAGLAAIACTGRFHRPREGNVPISVVWTSES